MNLKPQRDEPSPFDQDPEAVRGTRCLARLLLVFLVVALLNVLLIGGRETLHVTGWLLLPGAWGIFGAVQVLRHPERVRRLPRGYKPAHIIANGGVDLATLLPHPSKGETRLAIQDALDSVRRQGGRGGSVLPDASQLWSVRWGGSPGGSRQGWFTTWPPRASAWWWLRGLVAWGCSWPVPCLDSRKPSGSWRASWRRWREDHRQFGGRSSGRDGVGRSGGFWELPADGGGTGLRRNGTDLSA